MENTSEKSIQLKMNRHQFFLELGKKVAGLYVLTLGALSIKSLFPKRHSKPTTIKSDIKVSAHPMAVKRSKRG